MKSDNALNEIINKVDFLAFGETEHGTHELALDEILKEIDRFKRVFLEIPVNLQESVDLFLESNKVNDNLSDFLKGAQEEGKDVGKTLFLILKICRKTKKPVFCVDSSKVKTALYNKKSKHGFYFLSGESREEDMFNNIKKILENFKGKSFLLSGSVHIKYGINSVDNQKTLGQRLKEFLGARFYNVCLWRISGFRSCQFFDTHDAVSNRELDKLLRKQEYSNLNENNQRYFDGYLVHC